MPRYRMVVVSNPVTGREDEFNEWYDHQHVGDILAIEGIETAQRFRVLDGPGTKLGPSPYRYLALYEIETEDVGSVLAGLSDSSTRVPSNALDLDNTAVWIFEEIGDVRTAEPPSNHPRPGPVQP